MPVAVVGDLYKIPSGGIIKLMHLAEHASTNKIFIVYCYLFKGKLSDVIKVIPLEKFVESSFERIEIIDTEEQSA